MAFLLVPHRSKKKRKKKMALKINLSEAQIDLIKIIIIINIYKRRVCIYMLLAAGQDS